MSADDEEFILRTMAVAVRATALELPASVYEDVWQKWCATAVLITVIQADRDFLKEQLNDSIMAVWGALGRDPDGLGGYIEEHGLTRVIDDDLVPSVALLRAKKTQLDRALELLEAPKWWGDFLDWRADRDAFLKEIEDAP